MQIVLLGYMGSGKTTVGKNLARQMNFDFVDLDNYIEEWEGHSIAKLFEVKGEIYFRKKEHEYLKKLLSDNKGIVLSTGGGTPCYGDNMGTILERTPNAFYLKTSIKELLKRLSKEKEHRPLIKNIADGDLPEFIGKHVFERSFFYEKAQHTIWCDDKSPTSISKEIIDLLV